MNFKNTIFPFLVGIVLILSFKGCKDYKESFEIIRNPFINVTVGNAKISLRNVGIISLGPVMAFNEVDSVYEPFERLIMYGISSSGRFNKIQIILDVRIDEDLEYNYNFRYAEQGGIVGISWTTEDNDTREISSYSICPEDEQDGFLSITRHGSREKIISGFFHAVMCQEADDSIKLEIDGEFRDLNYEPFE